MNKLLRATFLGIIMLFAGQVSGQCTFGDNNYPSGIFTSTSTAWQTIDVNVFAGEYSRYSVVQGSTYEWSTCIADGGLTEYDSQLTLWRSTNTTTSLDYSDDDCDGASAKLTWTATFTGEVYVQLNEFDCQTNSTSSTLVFRRSAQGGGGTPFNDDCFNSTLVVATPTCSPISGNLNGATGSDPIACAGTNTDDVWFSVVSAGTGDILVEVTPDGPGFDPVVEVFSGPTCTNLTSIGCFDETLDGEIEDLLITNSAPLEIIWVRVYDYDIAEAANPSFTFCVSQGGGVTTPGDECGTAIPLVTNQECNPIPGDLGDFTASNTPASSCFGTLNSDVWYSLTATTDSVSFAAFPNGDTDLQIEIFEAGDCNNLTLIGCGDFANAGEIEAIILTETTAGEQFLIRVSDFNGNAAADLGFEICAYVDDFLGGPLNDECDGALPLTTTDFCNPILDNLGNYTPSIEPATTCAGTLASDAWFLITATTDSLLFNVTPTGNIDPIIEIFAGNDCAALELLGCGDFSLTGETESIILSPTLPGDQFYLRVSDFNGNTAADLGFEICAYNQNTAGPTPPVNDECDGAVQIIAGTSCNPIPGTLLNASASPPFPSDACGGTNNEDVWYEIIASDTAMTIEMTPDFGTLGIVAEIFVPTAVGDCSNLLSLGCVDETLAGETEIIDIINILPGQSVFVRIYDFITATPTNPGFTICAYWDPQSGVPSNDECAGAIPLSAGATCNPVLGDVGQATASLPISSCSPGGTVAADVWFSFVATASSANIIVTPTEDMDPVIQYFSGSCSNLTSRGCSDVFIEANAEQLSATGLIVGQTYFVRVYDYRGIVAASTEFEICIENNSVPSNDNCAGATPIALGNQFLVQDNALATQSSIGCTGTANDDVWFSFSAGENPEGTTITVLGDLDFESVFQLYSGTCASLNSVDCVNDVTTGTYDQEQALYTNLTPGQTYYLRVYDFQVSTTNSTFYLAITGTPVGCNLTAPTVSAQGSTTICGGESVFINSDDGLDLIYQWRLNGIDIPNEINSGINASVAGSYSLFVTDLQGCTALSNSVNISAGQTPTPVASASGSTTICGSGSVALSTPVIAGSSYQWFLNNNPVGGATQNMFNASNAGSYYVEVTNTSGCTGASNQINVTVVGNVTATISNSGNSTICQGSNAILTVNTQPGNTIQWKLNGSNINGANGTSFTATQAGNYSVDVSNGPTCNATSNTITISVVPGPNPTITSQGATTFCEGSSVALNVGTIAGASYQWLNNGSPILGANQQNFTAFTSGSYAVLVSTSACAATSNAIAVTANPSPVSTVFANGPTTFCQGNTVLLTGPQAPGLTYQWINNGNPIAGANSDSYTATTSGSYVLSITSSGCVGNSPATQVNVTPPPSSTITVNGNSTVCEGNTVQLSGPIGNNLSYQWSSNGNPIVGALASTYIAATSGNYTLTVSQGTNCSSTSNGVAINILAAPNATISAGSSTDICLGESVIISAVDSPDLTYQWQINGATIPGANQSSYAASAAGEYNLVVTNASACSSTSDIISVSVSPQPEATITPNGPTTFCIGNTVLLQATSGNGYTYQWNQNGNPLPGVVNSVFNVSASGSYTVVVTNQSGCSALSSAIQVNVAGTEAEISVDGNPAICDGNAVTLNSNVGAGLSYQWQNNGSNISGETSSSYEATVGGNYTVVITDANNCASTSQPITVTVGVTPDQPSPSVQGESSICEGSAVEITYPIAAGISYSWENLGELVPGGDNGTLTVSEAGEYVLTATNSANCAASSIPVSISVNPLPTVSLSLNPDTICTKGVTLTLAGGAPAGGNYSGDYVENGLFTSPDFSESVTITYTYTDNNGCSNSADAILKVVDCVGLNDITDEFVAVYPNPALDFVTLQSSISLRTASIELLDASGRLVITTIDVLTDNTANIKLSNLAAGVYQVVVRNGDKVYTAKIVKTV